MIFVTIMLYGTYVAIKTKIFQFSKESFKIKESVPVYTIIYGKTINIIIQRNEVTLVSEAAILLATKGSYINDPMRCMVGRGDKCIRYLAKRVCGAVLIDSKKLSMDCIWPATSSYEEQFSRNRQLLRLGTSHLARAAYSTVGDHMPDIIAFNQLGQLLTCDQLKGKYVILNFFFTRCSVPNMCPATIARMIKIQEKILELKINNVHLVSISFDSGYDTPSVLNAYGIPRRINSKIYSLLTIPDMQAKNCVMRQFGIFIQVAGNYSNHSMAVVLIDPFGKIVYRREGSYWSEYEFIQQLILLKSSANNI